MALFALLSIPMSSISLCIIGLITGNIVAADECRPLCGYNPPTTAPVPNQTCFATGDAFDFPTVLKWNDGTYSAFTVHVVTQLVIGSCFSTFRSWFYGTGVVTSGRFSGENVILLYNYIDERQTCNGCESNGGLSRVIADESLTIGTKGVGNWIECVGNATVLFSPPLTCTPQTIYFTYEVDWSDCSNCVQSC